MREKQRDWRSTWLFLLWALLIAGSLLGAKPGTVHSDKTRPNTVQHRTLGIFLPGHAASTATDNPLQ